MTDRMDTEALRSGLFLIVKRDLYYRPNDCGYTGIKDHAGRYTLEEVAVRFPNMESPHQDGTSFIAEEDAPEFTQACFWDFKLDHVTKQRDDARAEALELRAMRAAVEQAKAEVDAQLKERGMVSVDQLVQPFSPFQIHAGMSDLVFFKEWLTRKATEYAQLRAKREVKNETEDDMYDWLLGKSAAYADALANFNAATTQGDRA